MNRNNILKCALIGTLVVLLAAPLGVFAESNGADHTFSRQELD